MLWWILWHFGVSLFLFCFFFNYEFSEVWILYYNSLISNNLNIKIAYNAHPMFMITWGLQSVAAVHRAASLQNIDSFQNKHVLHVLKVPSIFLVFSVTGLNFDYDKPCFKNVISENIRNKISSLHHLEISFRKNGLDNIHFVFMRT